MALRYTIYFSLFFIHFYGQLKIDSIYIYQEIKHNDFNFDSLTITQKNQLNIPILILKDTASCNLLSRCLYKTKYKKWYGHKEVASQKFDYFIGNKIVKCYIDYYFNSIIYNEKRYDVNRSQPWIDYLKHL